MNIKLVKVAFLLGCVFCLSTFITGPIALVFGFLFSHFFGHPYHQLNNKAMNWLLKIAVVGLGFSMNFQEALDASIEGFSLTALFILGTLILGYIAGKWFRIERKIAYLISSGTAVCGGSAIAAIAPVINASEKSISVSLGVVFLLNSVALLCFPPIGHYFDLTEYQFGLWSAIAIHDTSSVVGAAMTYGEEAVKVATTVKLARALWIIPISLVSIFLFKGKNNSIKILWFIFMFIGVILLNSYFSFPNLLVYSITEISKSLLVLTLFLVGSDLSVEKIKSAGWKPMILGASLWIIISVISLLIIL
ncbi:MAG: putative sulfate exporter family transporter [Flavobacteriales bacterium]|nr:putative sulfate exporter family transporter [Flavobacteriales bacterium]